MALYQLLAKDKSIVTDNLELTLEQVQSYAEDNDLEGVFQYDTYEDGTDIFDAIGDDDLCLKMVSE